MMINKAEGLRPSARPHAELVAATPCGCPRSTIPAEAGIHWGGLNTPQADTVTANLRRGALRCAQEASNPQRTEGRAHLHITPRPIPLVPPLAKGDDEKTQRGFAPLHAPKRQPLLSFPRKRESRGVACVAFSWDFGVTTWEVEECPRLTRRFRRPAAR